MNKLKKMTLRVIAESISEEEIVGLKQMFQMIDIDNSSQITFEELNDGLKGDGANLKESKIYHLMQAVLSVPIKADASRKQSQTPSISRRS
nr:calcium-dependent protein kinase 1-like [Tanacetum cinerariifolium]